MASSLITPDMARIPTVGEHHKGNHKHVRTHKALLASSAQWLRDASVKTLSENGRISRFCRRYNILQAVQAPYPGKLETIRLRVS